MYCPNCGNRTDDGAKFCGRCGRATSSAGRLEPETISRPGFAAEDTRPTKSKLVAGILAILLGGIGIHKFYLGYPIPGILLIVITLVTLVVGPVIGLIEGIIYLTAKDEEFHRTYVVYRKSWF